MQLRELEIVQHMSFHLLHATASLGIPLQAQLDELHRVLRNHCTVRLNVVRFHEGPQGPTHATRAVADGKEVCPKGEKLVVWPYIVRDFREVLAISAKQ